MNVREIMKRCKNAFKPIPKARRGMLVFRNNPGSPVTVREAWIDQERSCITAMIAGHSKYQTFSTDEVDAILVETESGEIIRFDKTSEEGQA